MKSLNIIIFIFILTTSCSHFQCNTYRNEISDFKKRSLEWQKTFKNTSILDIPIIKLNNIASYSSSTDNPHGVRDMTVKYESKLKIDILIPIILSKLRKKGFKVNKGKVLCGAWAWRRKTDNKTIRYHGKSPKNECLYLEFLENKNLTNVNAGISEQYVDSLD